MMEEFIRNIFGNELANFYRDLPEKEQTQMDFNLISTLKSFETNEPISLEKDMIERDGKMFARFILEAEVEVKK